MTVKLLPETLRKRRAAKRHQKMNPRALRVWLDAGTHAHGEQQRELRSVGTGALSANDERHPGAG
jgi:hypothetical protein